MPDKLNAAVGINLYLIPQNCSVSDVLAQAVAVLYDDTRISVGVGRMLDSLSSGLGLQILVNTVRDLLGNPILVNDINYRVLALSEDMRTLDNIIREDGDDLYIRLSQIYDIKVGQLFEIARKSRKPIRTIRIGHPYAWMTAIVQVNGFEVGQIGIVEKNHPFTDYDYAIASRFCQLVAVEFQKSKNFRLSFDMTEGYFSVNLLDHDMKDRRALEKHMAYIGWPQGGIYNIVAIRGHDSMLFADNVSMLARQLYTLIPSSRWMIYEGILVLFIMQPTNVLLPQETISRLKEFLAVNNLFAGISTKFSNLLESRKYYKQALTAMNLGCMYDPLECLFAYENYASRHLVEIILEHSEKTSFVHPAIMFLHREDKKDGTELLRTLKYYLLNAQSVGEAAEQLHIHRNTLFYRLGRIRELTGINLRYLDERLWLYLSILLLERNELECD